MKKKSINRIAFLNFFSVLLLHGISLISSPLFSRLMGTEGYGNLSAFTVWAGLGSTVFSLQAGATIVNGRQEYPQEAQNAYQSSILSLSMLGMLLGGAAMLLFSTPICRALEMERWMVALMVVQMFGSACVVFLNNKFTYEFKAEQNMLLSVVMAVAGVGVSLVLILNLPMELRYLGRIVGNALVYGVAGVLICIGILRRGKTLFCREYWKFSLAIGVPLVFQNLAYSILGNSDLLMLRQLSGASDSGIYSLALNLAGILFTLFTALNSSWVPFFFDDMRQGRRENAVRQGKNFLELYTVLSAGFVLLVQEVYEVYAGEGFRSGAQLVPFFVASYFGNMLCTFPVNYEIHRRKTGVVASATVASALANLVLNYFLIRRFGMIGAAAATLLARMLQLVIHVFYVRFHLGRGDYPFPVGAELKACAALLLASVLFYATPDAWFLRWPLAALLGLWELLRIWKRKSLL